MAKISFGKVVKGQKLALSYPIGTAIRVNDWNYKLDSLKHRFGLGARPDRVFGVVVGHEEDRNGRERLVVSPYNPSNDHMLIRLELQDLSIRNIRRENRDFDTQRQLYLRMAEYIPKKDHDKFFTVSPSNVKRLTSDNTSQFYLVRMQLHAGVLDAYDFAEIMIDTPLPGFP